MADAQILGVAERWSRLISSPDCDPSLLISATISDTSEGHLEQNKSNCRILGGKGHGNPQDVPLILYGKRSGRRGDNPER